MNEPGSPLFEGPTDPVSGMDKVVTPGTDPVSGMDKVVTPGTDPVSGMAKIETPGTDPVSGMPTVKPPNPNFLPAVQNNALPAVQRVGRACATRSSSSASSLWR